MYLFAHNLLQWKNSEIEKRISSGNARVGLRLRKFWLAKEDRTPQEYYDEIAYPQEDTVPASDPVAETKTLPEMLAYAGRFQTDDGMTAYLKRNMENLPESDRRALEDLLNLSAAEIRKEIERIANA